MSIRPSPLPQHALRAPSSLWKFKSVQVQSVGRCNVPPLNRWLCLYGGETSVGFRRQGASKPKRSLSAASKSERRVIKRVRKPEVSPESDSGLQSLVALPREAAAAASLLSRPARGLEWQSHGPGGPGAERAEPQSRAEPKSCHDTSLPKTPLLKPAHTRASASSLLQKAKKTQSTHADIS